MANPLFSGFGNSGQTNPQVSPMNFANFIQNLNQFRAGLSGDPRQMVENLRASGQMSEQQFNQLSNMANSILPILGGRRF